MTINLADNNPRIAYSLAQSATQTTFAVPFEFFDNGDLEVYVDAVLKAEGTHYSITGGDGSTGNVVFSPQLTGISGGSTIVIFRSMPIERASDFSGGSDINRAALNEQLDSLTAMVADLDDRIDRTIQTNGYDINPSMVLPTVAARKGKALTFDPITGAVLAAQELGQYRGNWAASTAYVPRDLVKDTSTNNIFIVVTAHTSTGSQPLTTNTDSAKFALIVDAATATTSSTSAASSASAAATSATNASNSASAASTSAANASSSASSGSTSASNAASSQSAAATSASNASNSASSASTSATNAANSATAAAASQSAASTSASNASTSQTNASNSATAAAASQSAAATSATNAANSASSASTQASNASTSASNASTSESNASTSATNAAASAASAAASFDAFDDVYLGAKSSNPTLDNDGNALTIGDLYFNTASDELRIWNGSAWQAASSVSVGGGTVANLIVTGDLTVDTSTLIVDSVNNRVGVGTATPQAQLHVSGNTTLIAQFTAAISDTTMSVTAFTTGNGLLAVGDIVYGVGVSPITKITAQTSGTTGSTGDYTVSVSQTVISSASIFTGSPTASRIRISDTDTTTSLGQPTGSIEFFVSDTSSPAAGVVAYISAISEDSTPDTALTFGTRDADMINGGIDANERMRINSVGNVGIGTTDPLAPLHVNGTVRALQFQPLTDTDSAALPGIAVANDPNTGLFRPTSDTIGVSTGGTERMRIDSSGNVGIGLTAPIAALHVNQTGTGSSTVFRASNTAGGALSFLCSDLAAADPTWTIRTNANEPLAFNVSATEYMRISSSGFVGIGTTAPVTPLHVVGASITTGVTFQNQPTQTSKSAATTLTIAELLTGIVQFTGATIGTLTLPLGTDIEGGLPATFPTNMSFDFSVINTGTSAGAVTITTNTGLTLVGSMTVPITTSGLFRVRKTATNAYTIYRLC